MAEADFKFGTQLGFVKANHKMTPIGNVGVPWARGALHIFGVPLKYFCNG